MDWYLAVWVVGALLTWAVLTTERGKRLHVSPEIYYTLIFLWPPVWALAAVAGLIGLVLRLVGWFIGDPPRNQG
jgi:hypothetical protein